MPRPTSSLALRTRASKSGSRRAVHGVIRAGIMPVKTGDAMAILGNVSLGVIAGSVATKQCRSRAHEQVKRDGFASLAMTRLIPRSRLQLPRDEGLDGRARLVGLRALLGDPFVHGVREQVKLDVAAGALVGLDEFLLLLRQHVVVERALHDEERQQRDFLVALENLLWIGLVDSLPRN